MNTSNKHWFEPLAEDMPEPDWKRQQPLIQQLVSKRRPGWTFMLSNPFHIIAQGFGSGLAWFSPGTFGTLFGWLAFIALDQHLNDSQWFGLIVGGFVLGCLACHLTGKHLGVADHGSIVWDEIIAIWLVLWILPRDVSIQVWGFLVFRFFDIVKPPPIRYFDAKWKHVFGVMFDDLVAAFMTLLALALVYRIWG